MRPISSQLPDYASGVEEVRLKLETSNLRLFDRIVSWAIIVILLGYAACGLYWLALHLCASALK